MAGEITYTDPAAQTGLALYAVVEQPDNQVASGAALETYDAAHWTSYAIALTHRGAGRYHGDFPLLPAGLYGVTVRQRVGAGPAITDPLAGGPAQLSWDGTAEVGAIVTVDAVNLSLTAPQVQAAAAAADGELSLYQGDTLAVVITGLADLTESDKLWFTVKRRKDDADGAAILQIERTAGLVTLNGAAGTAGDGALEVDDPTAGTLTIRLAATASAALPVGSGYYYDVQMLAGAVVTTLAEGRAKVIQDVTGATS